jgi:hypothetical protein
VEPVVMVLKVFQEPVDVLYWSATGLLFQYA